MPFAKLTLRANKSRAYFDSLCKHFSRKVDVDRVDNEATVTFPKGKCHMSFSSDQMHFNVSARDQETLETVKTIIAAHVVRYGELKDTPVSWSD